MPVPEAGAPWEDRLVWGDGLSVMRAVPSGALSAVYLDPPFFTGTERVGDHGRFDDAWSTMTAYLDWLRPFVAESFRLLRADGWFWLHLDWHAVHYAKVMTDDIFGRGNFRNEIVWAYGGRRMPSTVRFNQKHDVILLYARSHASRLTPLFLPWSREEYLALKRQQLHRDPDGREWIWGHAGRGRPKAYRIDVSDAVERGRAVTSVWDIPILNTSDRERVGYPTQKPVELLRRVIASTVPRHGVVGDFMLGSGTTAVAARRLGRRFIGADVSADAIRVAVDRLLALSAVVKEGGWEG
jgi:site-specific DNA-methyltransferase (adenine-specific)